MVIEFVEQREWVARPPLVQLTPGQIDAFYREGYLVVEDVFDVHEIELISASFTRLAHTAQRFRETTMWRGTQFVVEPRADADEVRIHRVVWAGGAEPLLSAYGRDPRLVGHAGQIMGARRMEQLINQAHFKYPGDGVSFPWHQDSRHRRYGTPLWTDVDGRGSFVELITAVDEVTAQNGPLKIIPGSSQLGHLECEPGSKVLPEGAFDPSTAISIPMAPGSVLLLGPYTIHGSAVNESDRPRRLFLNGFALPGANRRTYPGADSGRSVWAPPNLLRPRIV